LEVALTGREKDFMMIKTEENNKENSLSSL